MTRRSHRRPCHRCLPHRRHRQQQQQPRSPLLAASDASTNDNAPVAVTVDIAPAPAPATAADTDATNTETELSLLPLLRPPPSSPSSPSPLPPSPFPSSMPTSLVTVTITHVVAVTIAITLVAFYRLPPLPLDAVVCPPILSPLPSLLPPSPLPVSSPATLAHLCRRHHHPLRCHRHFPLYCRLGGEPTGEPTRDDLMVLAGNVAILDVVRCWF